MAQERLHAALNLQHLTAMSTSCHRLPTIRATRFFHMTAEAENMQSCTARMICSESSSARLGGICKMECFAASRFRC